MEAYTKNWVNSFTLEELKQQEPKQPKQRTTKPKKVIETEPEVKPKRKYVRKTKEPSNTL